MTFLSAKGLIAICTLTGFMGMPNKITGPVVLNSKTFVVVKLTNANKTETIEITIKKEQCEVK